MEIFTGDLPFIELSREDMLKEKYSRSILPIIYGYLVPKIKEKYGIEGAIEKLRDFGMRVMEDLLKYWKPKKGSVSQVMKETYPFLFYSKIKKIEEVKGSPRKWILHDEHCPLCWEGIEETEIHYCVAFAGAIECLYNSLHNLGYKKIPKVRVNTISSKARGSEICNN